MTDESLTKADLADAIAEEHDLFKSTSRDVVGTIVDTIGAHLAAGGRVSLRGLGTFYVEKRDGRRYRDIHTGNIKTSEPRAHVIYRPSLKLVDGVQDA